MKQLTLILAIFALGLAALPAKAAVTYKTVSHDGYCSFQSRSDWKLSEDWHPPQPQATLVSSDSLVSISVTFYHNGDVHFPTSASYRKQIELPNKAVEKSVGAETPTTLDGRSATGVHLEMLNLMFATMHIGPKQTTVKDFVIGDYPGGYYVVTLSAAGPRYADASKDFQSFLANFKLLVPQPAAETAAPAAPAGVRPSAK